MVGKARPTHHSVLFQPLRNAQNIGSLLLRQVAMADDVANLAGLLRLDVHRLGIRCLQIGVDVTAAFFDLDHV
jgi:hypothetical protein